MKHSISAIAPFTISRGFHARMIHTDNMTIAYVDVDEGADLPEHAHVHEQVLNLLEGRFELIVNGQPHLLEPGDVFVIPSNAPHSGKAHTRCRIIDVFQPVREDFRNGNVAYAVR
ncbi:MAG: cupin domain-containing protein [Lewinellaceae bacterium]|jgi:quercetin dioxygenase-like cupin family protein|nr:cupin domain-containing protein [Lewinellaceae bacterium]